MLLTAAVLAIVTLTLLSISARESLAPHTYGLDLTTENPYLLCVNRVDNESVGSGMGLQSGDRILAVNGMPAASAWTVRNLILAGTPTVLYIGRGEQRLRSEITFTNTDGLTPAVARIQTTQLV